MADTTPTGSDKADELTKTKFWAGTLMLVGVLLAAGAAVLAIYSSQMKITTDVVGGDDPATKVVESSSTTVDSARIPDALVTTTLGAGAVLLVAGAFYRRISKVMITGLGEIDLEAENKVVEKATEASKGDPKKAAEITVSTLKRLRTPDLQVVDRWGLSRGGPGYLDPGPIYPTVTDESIDAAVSASATEVG